MKEKELENKNNGKGEEQKNETAPELPEVTSTELQLEEMQKQIDQYKDLLLRKAAEFDNYKRRIESEMLNIVKFANESLIEDLLPILDDFERSLKHSKENTDYNNLMRGIELIYQKLNKVLEGKGVKVFETIGKEFNVDFHDALLQQQRNDVPPHTIIEEVQKGYMLNDKVIRHAKVIVSSAPIEDQKEEALNNETEENAGGKK